MVRKLTHLTVVLICLFQAALALEPVSVFGVRYLANNTSKHCGRGHLAFALAALLLEASSPQLPEEDDFSRAFVVSRTLLDIANSATGLSLPLSALCDMFLFFSSFSLKISLILDTCPTKLCLLTLPRGV